MMKTYRLSHILQFPSLSVIIVEVIDTVVSFGVKTDQPIYLVIFPETFEPNWLLPEQSKGFQREHFSKEEQS